MGLAYYFGALLSMLRIVECSLALRSIFQSCLVCWGCDVRVAHCRARHCSAVLCRAELRAAVLCFAVRAVHAVHAPRLNVAHICCR